MKYVIMHVQRGVPIAVRETVDGALRCIEHLLTIERNGHVWSVCAVIEDDQMPQDAPLSYGLHDFANSPISYSACPFQAAAEYLSRFPDIPERAAAFARLMDARNAAVKACERWDRDAMGLPR